MDIVQTIKGKRLILLTIGLVLGYVSYSQCYKSSAIFIENKSLEDGFEYVDSVAYLDYNIKEMYVKLVFRDTLYLYKTKRTNKQVNKKRFTVKFKKTYDFIFWNTTQKGNYIFAMQLEGQTYWFKKLTAISREEINKQVSSLNN